MANRDLKSDVVDDVTKLSDREFQIGTILTEKSVYACYSLQEGLRGAENAHVNLHYLVN